MLRKLFFLAAVVWVAKKLMDEQRMTREAPPFPTSSRPPEGYRPS